MVKFMGLIEKVTKIKHEIDCVAYTAHKKSAEFCEELSEACREAIELAEKENYPDSQLVNLRQSMITAKQTAEIESKEAKSYEEKISKYVSPSLDNKNLTLTKGKMKISFDDKSYIDVRKSPENNNITIIISAKDQANPLKKITNAVEITREEWIKLISDV